MKMKKFLCTALVLLMLLPLCTPLSVSAEAETWYYTVSLYVANEKNAEAKGNSRAITATLSFENGTATGTFSGCDGKNKEIFTTNDKGVQKAIETDFAPWTLSSIKLKNNCSDGFKVYNVKVKVRCIWSSREESEYTILDYYPQGENTSKTGGQWIGGKNNPAEYSVNTVNAKRAIESVKYTDSTTVHLKASDANNSTAVEKGWDGTVLDQYKIKNTNIGVPAKGYNSWEQEKPPTFSIFDVTGTDKSGTSVVPSSASQTEKKDTLKGYGIETWEKGIKYTPSKVLKKMTEQGVSSLRVELLYIIPCSRSGKWFFTESYSFKRDVFEIEGNSLLDSGNRIRNSYTAGTDRNYFNRTGQKRIVYKPQIKTTGAYRNFSETMVNGKYFYYDEAYIKTRLADGKEYRIDAEKINNENKAKIENGKISFYFDYAADIDSNNNGLTVVIKGGRMNIYGTEYDLYDSSTGKYSDQEKYMSAWKIDSKTPEVTIKPVAGQNPEEWNKSVSFEVKADETIYKRNDRKENVAELRLFSGGTSANIFKINYDPTKTNNSTTKYASQEIPLTKSNQKVTIALADEIEGVFALEIKGEDVAANAFVKIYSSGIKLDNKAPVVSIKESEGIKDTSTGLLTNTYTLDIQDASKTGRVYYMFTEKSLQDAKQVPFDNNGQESENNEMTTLLDKWRIMDQKDIESGKTNAVTLTIGDGEKFNGRMVYYAEDALKNNTGYQTFEIGEMTNESTAYKITPSNPKNAAPAYNIYVDSGENTVSYRWKEIKNGKTEYLFKDYRPYNGGINTQNDPETANLNGQYILELEIVTPNKTATIHPESTYVFDNAGPEIEFTLPSSTSFLPEQTVSVKVDDSGSGVSASGAVAKVVNPDGSESEYGSEFNLTVQDDGANRLKSINQSLRIIGMPSGAYAVKVTAADSNGKVTTKVSDPFYIRESAPSSVVSIKSDYSYKGSPAISKDDKITFEFDVREDFNNPTYAKDQALFYRVRALGGEWSAWTEAVGITPTTQDGGLNFTGNADVLNMALTDGEGELAVQTAISVKGSTKIDLSLANEVNAPYLFDETPPVAEYLDLTNLHQKEPITGKLYVSDNISNALTAECSDENVEIGEWEDGAFEITVSKNTSPDTKIYIYDDAHNRAEETIDVYGIDFDAPTAEITVDEPLMAGTRKDATATVTVYNMSENFTGEMFALIPNGEYTSGKIDDKYFMSNLDEKIHFEVKKTRSDTALWSDETTNTYSVKVAGVTGEWLLGVRAEDALGNSADIVFKDDVLVTENQEMTLTKKVTPKYAQKKTMVVAEFNVPVYVLPQDKIADTGDEDNFELLEEYAMFYSQKATFAIDKTGTYKVYAIDDLGRAKRFDVTVTDDDVTFDSAGDVEVKIVREVWTEEGTSYMEDVTDAVLSPTSQDYGQCYIMVEPSSKSADTLLLPQLNLDKIASGEKTFAQLLEGCFYDYSYRETNGFGFDFNKSDEYVVRNDGEPHGTGRTDFDKIKGFTKLIYGVEHVRVPDLMIETYADIKDRVLEVMAFNKNNEPTSFDVVSQKSFVISNFDNTIPEVDVKVTPNVVGYERNDDGILYEVLKPTMGDVKITLSAQDKESGINDEDVIALQYNDPDGNFHKIVPELNGTDHWEWDGTGKSAMIRVYNAEIGDFEEVAVDSIPVKITYDSYADKFGVKKLEYTFTEEFSLDSWYGMKSGIFKNTLGGEKYPFFDAGRWEGGVSSIDMIYDAPIEENVDYKLVYKTKDGAEIDDLDTAYYNTAVAEIVPLERGEERGLYVSNNGGATQKTLTVYNTSFEFKLKDKYSYEASKTASLVKTDSTPGTIDYSLSNTAKTNSPVTVTITAADNESGVGSVSLKGTEEIRLLQQGGKYLGGIEKNGTYSIVMYDNAGNKTAKSFSVSNIDITEPEASITYSSGANEWGENGTDFVTSRPVTAKLSFSKPNVKITGVQAIEGSTITSADYTVSYDSSMITFIKNGALGVLFTDDYGNEGAAAVSVGNIDATPPKIEPVQTISDNLTQVDVEFRKVDILQSAMDQKRTAKDIIVTYGGMSKKVQNEDDTYNSFSFTENGTYTFKVHDGEGLTSYLNITVTGIDKSAPKIEKVKWFYDYDKYNEELGKWETNRVEEEIIPTEGTVGYRVGTGKEITNKDVTVQVTTDADTHLLGGTEEYSKTQEKVYDQNGLFVFDTQKKNGLVTSYGVDIQVIDKTPPVIELTGGSEAVFYENPQMGEFDESLLGYKAYDVLNGKTIDYTGDVKIDWGNFKHTKDDFYQNTFDSSKPYTITYEVSDAAHNITRTTRTIRLVGLYDTVALVNGALPDYAGNSTVNGDKISIELKNFSGTAYVKYEKGVYTMGQMKKMGTVLSLAGGKYELSNLEDGWYTFFIQTDKRDYFTLNVYVMNY